MSIFGININHDLKIVAKKSMAIIISNAIVFSQSSFKILELFWAQVIWSVTFSLYFSKIVISNATIVKDTEKRAISILIIVS